MFNMNTIGIIVLLISSVYGKPFSFKDDAPTCGYSSCHAVDHNKINVHLIPHSHDDVGWLSTVDQYYYNDVQYIISSVVDNLLRNSDRRFIQVETAYFYMWWNLQDDHVKADVRKLISEGRLEIVNGAWSMNDEAAVHYQSTIDQYTVGLRFIEDILGKCARPRVGWQIDPFGHSREQASLLTQFGMDGVFFARIDYRDKDSRRMRKSLDMLWTGSANLGSDSNIFTSTLYNHYSAPTGFCFDVECNDVPIITDKNSSEYNVDKRVDAFLWYINEQHRYYPTNNILFTLGDDFNWKAAHMGFSNIDKLIEGFKLLNPKIGGKEINIIYSTPSCYTKAVHDFAEVNKHHDAITGTEKTHVEKNYHKSLVHGMQRALLDISSSFSSILGLTNDLNLKSCLLSNVSICTESDKDEFTVLIYNPLSRKSSHYIQIPVSDGTWKITGPSGEDVESHLSEPIGNFDYITKATGEKVLEKVLFFRAESLPALGYKVYNIQKTSSNSKAARAEVGNIYQMGFSMENFILIQMAEKLYTEKKNYRPTYEYTDIEPQAGNYYPVNTKILIKDGQHEFAVLPDRSEGGTSLSSGEVELMLSRALLNDDRRGVNENLNELEYNQQLVVRGSHFVTLGESSQGNNIPVKEQSFLNKELPENIDLLTIENWKDTENSVLIRLEHILEKDEDPELSKEVTVDISDLFKTLKIKSMKEFLLAGNTPLEETTRLKWSQISEPEDESSPLSMKNRLARDESDLKITLAPMQIRTFIATMEKTN
ncbi:hypothetical protein NQ314_011106 [Rhamnusium bicolor]|uniref:alpha-mannosidase n=1 Tax=Rhamnusium bicolor TaxID=1586634 RepID=A0AAV8XM08_9CUCU|nr:hypothetical protein NQ314_011106 [Rhamnusium bicolor]